MSHDGGVNAALLNMCARAQAPPTSSSTLSSSSALEAEKKRPPPRSQEDYKWLQDAMASVEPTEKKILRLLNTVEDQRPEALFSDTYLEAVEELGDLVEDINWAKEFALMNGPRRILNILSQNKALETEVEARNGLLLIIAHSSQLNSDVQQKFSDANWHEYLLPLLRELIRGPASSTAAALHACSCLCRSSELNTITFIQNGGLEILEELLRLPDGEEGDGMVQSDKVLRRTMFLVGSLAEFGVSTTSLIRGVCRQISRSGASDDIKTTGAQALLDLCEKSLKTVREVVAAELKVVLREWRRLSLPHDDPRQKLAKKMS